MPNWIASMVVITWSEGRGAPSGSIHSKKSVPPSSSFGMGHNSLSLFSSSARIAKIEDEYEKMKEEEELARIKARKKKWRMLSSPVMDGPCFLGVIVLILVTKL